MALKIAIFSLTSLVHVSFASRAKVTRGDNEWPGLSTVCPEKLSLNQRDECIDNETKAIAEDHCCDDLRWCNERLPVVSESYSKKMMEYFTKCQLQESDVAPNSEGKYQVVNNTKLCTDACQDKDELRENNLPSYESLEGKCEGHKELQGLEQKGDIVSALYHGFQACTTTTTTSTTTTTADFFDFTQYFNLIGTYHGQNDPAFLPDEAQFPDGFSYHCCCKPDHDRNSVDCVLARTDAETFMERFSLMMWSPCSGKMGGKFPRSWNDVFQSSFTNKPLPEFEGLVNRGKCIVQNERLPQNFRNLPHKELKTRLHTFAEWNGIET